MNGRRREREAKARGKRREREEGREREDNMKGRRREKAIKLRRMRKEIKLVATLYTPARMTYKVKPTLSAFGFWEHHFPKTKTKRD